MLDLTRRLLGLILVLILSLNSIEADCPPHVPYGYYEALTPFFVTEDHPAKKHLDKIFSSDNILKNSETLKAAGFKVFGSKGWSKVKVLEHKKLKGYLIKAFTDDQINKNEWEFWIRRIEGSIVTRNIIAFHQYENHFVVPKKWVYQVSREGESSAKKHFVLLVEKMNIFDQRGNHIMWKGDAYITKERLDALYVILKEAGLLDSVYIDNIPFTLDEKIAFIDTEYYFKWPVPYNSLIPFLSRKMQVYWRSLISSGS